MRASPVAGGPTIAPTAVDGRRLGHLPALDGVRAVAVLPVVAYHFSLAFWPRADGMSYLPGGFLGVDLFFVLSGFLITSILLDEQQGTGAVDLRRFYLRRAYRLLPALVVVLAGVVAMSVVSSATSVRTAGFTSLQALAYVGNLAGTFGWEQAAELRHVWSLAVEEQFYMVWPLLLLVLARRRRVVVATTLAVLVVGSVLLRVHWFGDGNLGVVARTEVRADSLLLGALAGCVHRWRLLPPGWGDRLLAIGLLGFAVLLAVPQELAWYARWGYTLVAAACALVVLGAADARRGLGGLLAWRPLREVGRVSYGVYLWHVVVAYAVARHTGPLPAVGKLVLATGLTAAVVLASWWWVETPWLARKARVAPPTSPPTEPVGVTRPVR